MKRAIELRPGAQGDIDDIWEYSVAQWNADQADRYVRDLKMALELIAANPFLGSNSDGIYPGLRKLSVGSHSIYYLHEDHLIDVVRVLHQRMDASGKFGHH
jgi:toxin ParE1/3/4